MDILKSGPRENFIHQRKSIYNHSGKLEPLEIHFSQK